MPAKTASINVRVDKQLKEDALRDLDALGLDMSTLIVMTLKAVTREHALPFLPTLKPSSELAASIDDIKTGQLTEINDVGDYFKQLEHDADAD
ncbi:type II toxin-antitoxin system RelB/DinJ family antitoxin [Lacticaseibacillus mingshuiensis]|uniref:type II toxin-antitoxin system RelB/DinJ family antitoxin n=1 Tax=Lacticaseibacillus mingshuiensis TaxID=2799574 RepID=UPI00194F89E3|nr:type II toxin-antitoxin system RelB/DinJ family antitoxin [Lacticaseibacillus mingshuiensis]